MDDGGDQMIMRLARTLLFFLAAIVWPAAAQVWDSSGNSNLNGSYYFRELIFSSTDEVAVYGGITFSGNGTYTISAQAIHCNQASCNGGAYNTSGTYSISASGYGFLSNQLIGGSVYGLVGANGIFVGSSTESGDYDLFIAAPISGQSTATLQGAYSLAYIYPGSQIPYDALIQMNSNGAGTIGATSVSAYTTGSSPINQSISSFKYTVSNNAFVLNFPDSSTAAIAGQAYLYSSPDGNFVFGGSPQDFDMFVGVRTGASGSGLGGLYYEAGMEIDNSQLASTGQTGFDTFYGSLTAASGVIIGQERIQFGQSTASGYTYEASYPVASAGGYTDSATSTQYTIGSGGAVRIGLGIGPYLSISAAIHSPSFSGSGVYLAPTGVVNSASFAPFTAGVSPGEFITLFGTGLGPSTLQVASAIPFPTTLGGVQVLINNRAAPIYYVSSTQISVIVPYEITSAVAQIQVVYNETTSNTVTAFVNKTTPGVFTIPPGGTSYAAAEHADGSLVTPSHPAQVGETISVYLTGLGAVSPSVADGAAGSSSTLSNAINTISADVNGVTALVSYSGLAPGLVGLYQVNAQIPSGVATGDNFLEISGPDGYSSEALISVGGGSTSSVLQSERSNISKRPPAAMRMQPWGNRPVRVPSPQ